MSYIHSTPVASVIGGTGFLGQYIVRALLKAGYHVKVYSRFPEKALQLKTLGTMGRLQLIRGNIRSRKTLENATNADVVVNLVGLLYEKGNQRFREVHATSVKQLAHLAAMKDVKRFIQISALGVDRASKSRYASTKRAGEEALLDEYPHATIVRPSIIFGSEDNFFNKFERMSRYLPFLPLIGGGHTLFQPVYVKDVAEAVVRIIKDKSTEGHIYELGGPAKYSFKELLEYLLQVTGRTRALINVPFPIAMMQARFFEFVPVPPLTRDQVELLKTNNVVEEKKYTFKALGIEPESLKRVVPGYVRRSCSG